MTPGVCISYRQEILQGLHQPDDEYRVALFTSDSSIGPETATYDDADAEASGDGYDAGGQVLQSFRTGLDGTTAWLSFDDATWTESSITARGCLIYNATRGNAAVAVLDFGADKTSYNGAFNIRWPAEGATAVVTVGEA